VRDHVKVVIGVGCAWGLYALLATHVDEFNFTFNDSVLEIVSIMAYGLSLLPACILAIWYRKVAAIWLILLTPVAAVGFIYQITSHAAIEKAKGDYNSDLWTAAISASIPAILGIILFFSTDKPEK